VSFNTSSIAGGTYYVSFQLNNDNTAGNLATLSNFSFGGGSAGSAMTVIRDGNSTGDLNGGSISLTDPENSNDLSNRFLQQFLAGSNFGFRLVLTTNINSGPDDLGFDAFRFSILDAAFNELATTDPVTGEQSLDIGYAVRGAPEGSERHMNVRRMPEMVTAPGRTVLGEEGDEEGPPLDDLETSDLAEDAVEELEDAPQEPAGRAAEEAATPPTPAEMPHLSAPQRPAVPEPPPRAAFAVAAKLRARSPTAKKAVIRLAAQARTNPAARTAFVQVAKAFRATGRPLPKKAPPKLIAKKPAPKKKVRVNVRVRGEEGFISGAAAVATDVAMLPVQVACGAVGSAFGVLGDVLIELENALK